MQSPITQQQSLNIVSSMPARSESASTENVHQPFWFRSQFVGYMEMHATAREVADYLDVHQGWFRRCAEPMTVEPIGANGYALTLGRFGAFNYEVEPKFALELLPQEEGIYRIRTIPIPDYIPPGYEVDFQATQILREMPVEGSDSKDKAQEGTPSGMTRVEWNLDLSVGVYFPRFIRALPNSLIQRTGDRLVAQIVKQVSRRLTRKVQNDFHATLGDTVLDRFEQYNATRGDRFSCEQV